MGLDKKELDKVVAFVKKVKELPGNEEFLCNELFERGATLKMVTQMATQSSQTLL